MKTERELILKILEKYDIDEYHLKLEIADEIISSLEKQMDNQPKNNTRTIERDFAVIYENYVAENDIQNPSSVLNLLHGLYAKLYSEISFPASNEQMDKDCENCDKSIPCELECEEIEPEIKIVINTLLKKGLRLAAIQAHFQAYPVSLKESKVIVDKIWNEKYRNS